MTYETHSDQETFDLAKNLAKDFKGGDVIGLIGDLGAGKTVFSKGLAAGLGVTEMVTSPTFVVMKVYECHNNPSIKLMCHIDAYRLNNEVELVNMGISDYLKEPDAITVIEWADKISTLLPKETTNISIIHSEHGRKITVQSNG
ncbi:tRNA (adenosine(37)-N6)-threonylcarbamoyltransferase complex ATPase subunit type 1 TsaE [Candidatus Falkowbacteria bacterium]|nr:tRNA (adenosine(37)-N6)-threonylcarbamoyltransferase complex ATPase subunit type 1 TsaE [Candidatus Falkowbacteria bacterium]